MKEEIMSHDGLPDNIAPERLLAKKIKAGVATPGEALEWLRITASMRRNAIGVTACEIIQNHCFVFVPADINHSPGEDTMNINELPAIGSPMHGGIFAGIAKADGEQPQAFLILLDDKPAEKMTWNQAMEWAASLADDAHLPSLTESALLYANLKDQFESYWHWTSTQYSSDSAYVQYFGDGTQGYGLKDTTGRAHAVRRLSVI